MTAPPLNYDEARACTQLAERAREINLAESGERGASTLHWWRHTLETYHREIEPLDWRALNALPRGALWLRLCKINANHFTFNLARIHAAIPERMTNDRQHA